MARIFCCVMCRVELEPVRLADGTSAVLCTACDVIGFAHEVVHGGRLIPAETAAARLVRRPRPGVR